MPDQSRKLIIGGEKAEPGWEVWNIRDADYVDHVGDAVDLSRFEDNTFSEIYASHVLQTLCFGCRLENALSEWFRVSVPGAMLYASVPNLEAIARINYRRKALTANENMEIMQILYGKQTDEHDFHNVGLTPDILAVYVQGSGYSDLTQVDSFNLFDDSSTRTLGGLPISYNITAGKPA